MVACRLAPTLALLVLAACDAPDFETGWSIAVLPDTQHYASRYPKTFAAQTKWIREQANALGIELVLHVGDITDDNGEAPNGRSHATPSIRSKAWCPTSSCPATTTMAFRLRRRPRDPLARYFPVGDARDQPTFGGLFDPERLDNSWHLVETPNGPWLVLALEFGRRDEVVEWADEILSGHPDVPTIVVTHAYLYDDDTQYDIETRPDQQWSAHHYGLPELPGGVNDGEALFQKLIRRHDQIDFVFCGHVLGDGVGRLTSTQDGGGLVHELLANYQEPFFLDGGRRILASAELR